MKGFSRFIFPDGRNIPQKMVEGGLQLHFPLNSTFTLEEAIAKRIFPKRIEPEAMLEELAGLRNPVVAKHPGGLYMLLITA